MHSGNALLNNRFSEKASGLIFYIFSSIILISLAVSIYSENYYLLLIPSGILFLYLSLINIKFIYFLLLITIPLSIEIQLPNGFATDFPTELLTGGLMILFIALVLAKPQIFDIDFLKNPLFFLVVIHYAWILITSIFSEDAYVSFKFFLAKTWYLTTFLFVTAIIIKRVEDFKIAFWCLLIPLFFTMVYTLVNHAKTGFTFQTVNTPMLPFFRNHVNYACSIAQMIPLSVLAVSWYRKRTLKRRFLIISILLMLVAVYFSYTRSAWLSLLAAAMVIAVIRFKLMKPAVIVAFAGSICFFIYMGINNHYLTHAPDYETTVYHTDLSQHLESTFEGKDISSAERIYRWVAGIRMWMEHPVMGFGPGNFNNFYKAFTVSSFRTYVSDNPERSSIHNYFLLVLTEQGLIGMIIFVALTVVIFINGERIYFQTVVKEERRYVLALLLCLVIIYVNTFLSDLLETAKIGSLYFICIALLINQDIRNKKQANISVGQTILS